MVDVSGIPNMGFGGGGYFGGSASLGLPAMSADQINASMGGYNPNAAAFNPWGNTPGGFGGQTDYYSALGAAYGRSTGGFGGYDLTQPWGGGADPFAGYGQSALPDTSWYQPPAQDYSSYSPWGAGGADFSYLYQQPQAAATPDYWSSYFNSLTGGAQQANPYTGVSSGYNPFDQSTYGLGASWQAPAQPSWSTLGYDPSIFGGGFQSMPASAWGSSYYGGDQGGSGSRSYFDYAGSGYDPFNSNTYGAAASWYTPQTPDYQWGQNFWGAMPGGGIGAYGMGPGFGGFNNYGNDDFAARFGAAGGYDPNSFANRFAAGGYYGAGSPSMYYTGNQYGGGGAMPPGFSGNYSFDNQGGALPLNNPFGQNSMAGG